MIKLLERVQSPYNEVEVWQGRDGEIDLDVIGATHATWHPSKLLTGHAWDAITAGTCLHTGQPTSLLMLGLGGGTVTRQVRHLFPSLQITAVEIDPEMVRLAQTYMGLESEHLDIHVVDAFDFLEQDDAHYDLVVDDLYKSGDTDVERPRVFDSAMLNLLRERLKPGGTLVSNFVIGKGHHKQHMAARSAYTNAFADVRAVRSPYSINEAIAGSDRLRAPRRLKPLAQQFTSSQDQELWRKLRTIKLR